MVRNVGVVIGAVIEASSRRATGGDVPFVLNGDWMWLIGAVALVYLLGLWRINDDPPWSPRGTVAFYAGLGVLLVAFVSPLDNYDIVSLFADVAQHLLLMFVAAPLIVLGRPVTLALRASPLPVRRTLERVVRTRTVASLTHPAVFWMIFLGIQAGTLFTSFYNQALNSTFLHVVEHAVYFSAAFLFWWPITRMEPVPRHVSVPALLVYLLVALPVLAGMGIALISATRPPVRSLRRAPRPMGRPGGA